MASNITFGERLWYKSCEYVGKPASLAAKIIVLPEGFLTLTRAFSSIADFFASLPQQGTEALNLIGLAADLSVLKPYANAARVIKAFTNTGKNYMTWYEAPVRIQKVFNEAFCKENVTKQISSVAYMLQKIGETLLFLPDGFEWLNLGKVCQSIGACRGLSFITNSFLIFAKDSLVLVGAGFSFFNNNMTIIEHKQALARAQQKQKELLKIQRLVKVVSEQVNAAEQPDSPDPLQANLDLLNESTATFNFSSIQTLKKASKWDQVKACFGIYSDTWVNKNKTYSDRVKDLEYDILVANDEITALKSKISVARDDLNGKILRKRLSEFEEKVLKSEEKLGNIHRWTILSDQKSSLNLSEKISLLSIEVERRLNLQQGRIKAKPDAIRNTELAKTVDIWKFAVTFFSLAERAAKTAITQGNTMSFLARYSKQIGLIRWISTGGIGFASLYRHLVAQRIL